jgi:plastocyanin
MLLTPTAIAQETVVVETRDNVFAPAEITIKAGDSIEFRNTGLAPHTAEDKDGSFNSGNLNSGQSATIRFDNEGTFQLICIYHETVGMTGRIAVSGAGGSSAASATPSPTPSPTEAAAPAQAEFDPDAGLPLGMKVFPFAAGALLLLFFFAIGLGYIRNVQKTTETQ